MFIILRLARCMPKRQNSLSKNYDIFAIYFIFTMKTFYLIKYHKVKGSHRMGFYICMGFHQ